MFQFLQSRLIPIDEVECDPLQMSALCVSFAVDDSSFAASIRRVGLIQPVVLMRLDSREKYNIVCGMRRVMAVRSLGWQEIPARILPADVTCEQAVLLSIEDNLTRGLSAVEMSIAIEKLRCLGWSRRRLVREFLPLAGMPPSEHHLDRLAALRLLPDALLQRIHAGELDASVSELFAGFSEEDRRALIALLFDKVRLSLGASKDVVDCLRKLAGRRGTTIAALLEEEDIRQTLAADASARRKGEMLRELLRQKALPCFSTTKRAFEDIVRRAALGKTLDISPSRYFETDEIVISMRATNPAAVRSAAESILRGCDHGLFDKLFRIVQNKDDCGK